MGLGALSSDLDSRSPYAAATAVVRTIARLSPELKNQDSVWEAFSKWRGADLREYIRTVRRTEHSIFYYQLQHLYEFGIEHVPAQWRDDFCFLAGQDFTEVTLSESVYPILQLALAQPGRFQATFVEMIRLYLYRFAGNKYQLTAETNPKDVVLTIQDRFAEAVEQYLRQFELDPERCFYNSFSFIAGGVDFFSAQVIKGYQTQPHARRVRRAEGTICLPVAETNVFDYERLIQTLLGFIQQIQSRQRQESEVTQLESDLVVASPVMRETWDRVRRASRSDELVLLLGESGTGKTFIANKIHSLSRRNEGPFIQVGLTSDLGSDNLIQSNLFGHERGAFTGATEQKQGLFSLAQGGTILLDEIGDASPELQAKLLRVIETSTFKRLGGVRDIRVDVRVIAATHRPLEVMVREGKFRQDLYYRLNVIPIYVPPLRQQPESIPALIDFFLARLIRTCQVAPKEIAPDLLTLLQRYSWPGNIRELEHALRHAVTMSEGETLCLADFPSAIAQALQGRPTFDPASGRVGGTGDQIINLEALRTAIAACDPQTAASTARKYELPCHIDFARRAYLAELIRACNGNLSFIGHYWDHHSEKTLRNLICTYGLGDQLHAARKREVHDTTR